MVMLLLAAFFAVASTASSAAAANWTVVPKTDCDGGDVKTHLPCAAHPPHTSPPVPELKACCLSLGPTCGGFNTHGVMKLVGCRQHEIAEPTVDLYILDLPPCVASLLLLPSLYLPHWHCARADCTADRCVHAGIEQATTTATTATTRPCLLQTRGGQALRAAALPRHPWRRAARPRSV